MRKILFLLLFCCVSALSLTSPLLTPLSANAISNVPQLTTAQFELFTDFEEDVAVELVGVLLQLHAFYEQFFDFPVDTPRQRMRIRYFATKKNFDDYVISLLGERYEYFLFLDYGPLRQSELLIFQTEDNFYNTLAHFAFVQFLENAISEPPAWLRDGYARYFEGISYNPETETLTIRRNEVWLNRLKEIIDSNTLIDLRTFFQMTDEEAKEQSAIFYAQAWGMVDFLISYRERNNDRFVRDINDALSADATESENIEAVAERLRNANDLIDFELQFREYIKDLQSVNEIIDDAIMDYSANNIESAEQKFYNAITLDNRNYVPYYYLGLINYERKSYSIAERLYIQTLERGADNGTVYYALALNSLAQNDLESALIFFNEARELQPALRIRIDPIVDRYY